MMIENLNTHWTQDQIPSHATFSTLLFNAMTLKMMLLQLQGLNRTKTLTIQLPENVYSTQTIYESISKFTS
jgi:hypothetical protein